MSELPTWVQGSVRPSPLVTWYLEDTTTPLDLTNTTISGVIYNVHTDTARAVAGDFVVTDGTAGEFRWDLDAADVEDYGDFLVQFTAVFPAGQTPAKTFSADWRIDKSLVAS